MEILHEEVGPMKPFAILARQRLQQTSVANMIRPPCQDALLVS